MIRCKLQKRKRKKNENTIAEAAGADELRARLLSATKTFYDILEVAATATLEEIKKAYRALALRWHPDRNAGSEESEEMFRRVAEAYGVLADAELRALYDAGKDWSKKAADRAPPPQDVRMDLSKVTRAINLTRGGREGSGVGT